MNLGLSVHLPPLPGSPGFPAFRWGGFRLGRDPGVGISGRCPEMGQSPPVRARRQTRTGGARNAKCRLLCPCCRLGRCSHTSSSARLMGLNCPFPQGSWMGGRGSEVHSEAKSAPSARWGFSGHCGERSPYHLSAPHPAVSRTLSEVLAAAEGLKQLMERGWREGAPHTNSWKSPEPLPWLAVSQPRTLRSQ